MNFHARLLAGDIRKMRPGLDIEPGHFIDNIPDYSMIIRGKIGDLMEDVRIFSKESKKYRQVFILKRVNSPQLTMQLY